MVFDRGVHRVDDLSIVPYVDTEEVKRLRQDHGTYTAVRIARQNAAMRIIERKSQDPDADRELLAVLHYLIAGRG